MYLLAIIFIGKCVYKMIYEVFGLSYYYTLHNIHKMSHYLLNNNFNNYYFNEDF